MSDIDDDLDEILGSSEPKSTWRKQRAEKSRVKPGTAPLGTRVEVVDYDDVMHGVKVSTLAHLFRMDRAGVKRRLSGVTPMRRDKGGDIYDLRTAAEHLVDPVLDADEFLAKIEAKDLPIKIQRAYWQGQKERIQYMEKAGQLWSTDVVLGMFARIFKLQRDRMNLWVDSLDAIHELNDDQRQHVRQLVDSLQDEIFESIQEMAAEQKTYPVLNDETSNDDPTE